jgi:alpha-D-ribose 1-methylphosphonate 5-triphosphate synthase subunit PhnH
MYGDMSKLARVMVLDEAGKDYSVRAVDIVRVREVEGGSELTIEGVGTVKSQSTVSQVDAAVDAFWDAWLAAFPA